MTIKNNQPSVIQDKKILVILGISVLSALILFSIEAVKLDSAYHLFADSRIIAQVPNFFNVASNLPFIIVGFLGLRLCVSTELKPDHRTLNLAYLLFFIGVLLTGFGSAFYHYRPDNSGLLWDRLPLTISFMAFFCIVIGECISKKIAMRLLLPFLALGIASVGYWYLSELSGRGDLRFYILVQFVPIILMPVILWLYEGKKNGCSYVWAVLGTYFLAKFAESFDATIYHYLQIISGHSLKHLLAGLGVYIVYAALRQRLESR